MDKKELFLQLNSDERADYINNRIEEEIINSTSEYEDVWEMRSKIAAEMGETPTWISFILSQSGYKFDDTLNKYVLCI